MIHSVEAVFAQLKTPGLRTTAKCLAVQNFHVEITIGLGVVLLYVFMTTNFEEVQ